VGEVPVSNIGFGQEISSIGKGVGAPDVAGIFAPPKAVRGKVAGKFEEDSACEAAAIPELVNRGVAGGSGAAVAGELRSHECTTTKEGRRIRPDDTERSTF
jgi:hypothetical protein